MWSNNKRWLCSYSIALIIFKRSRVRCYPSCNEFWCKQYVLKNQSASSARTLQAQIRYGKIHCMHRKIRRKSAYYRLPNYSSNVRANNWYRALSLQCHRFSVTDCCSGQEAAVYSLYYWCLFHTTGPISFNGVFDGPFELLAI